MRAFVESALSRKPLRLVRVQAHLGDGDSRYVPVSLLRENDDDDDDDDDGSTYAAPIAGGEGGGGGGTSEDDAARGGRPPGDDGSSSPSHLHHRRRRARRTAPLRHMSLLDLIAFGVGCTVGGGVFVLGGVSAHSYAGPSSSLSYLISGCVVLLSALPYAELSSYFPIDGSTYSYAYISLGEIFAVLSSMCQTLEYGVGASAVARSWGNKVVNLAGMGGRGGEDDDGKGGYDDDGDWMHRLLDPGYCVNPLAGIVSLVCTLVLLLGVRESKLTTNILSSMKVSLVLFMIVAGLLMSSGIFPHTEASYTNWVPFVPSEFGIDGVLGASSLLIFAYTGFDCICNQAGEAMHPVRDVPRAVVVTILIDGALYVLAALALTSMLPYAEISAVSGFPDAFGANGWAWAMWITAVGEIVVLPLVVLASIQAQTRLLFAMSADGIVPKFFGRLSFSSSSTGRCHRGGKEDEIGNLSANVKFCGFATVVMATFVPIQYLIELVAAGALLLFSMTSSCMLTVRYKCPSESFLGSVRDVDDDATIFSVATVRRELSLGRILILLNVFPFLSGLCFAYIPTNALRYSLTVTFAFLALLVTFYIAAYCHENISTRFLLSRDGYETPGRGRFRTPLVPFMPALGIYLNWFMLANLGWKGIVMLIGYLFVGVVLYWKFCVGRSIVNRYDSDGDVGGYKNRNILPGNRRASPPSSTMDLQQSLLGGEDVDENEAGHTNDVFLSDELSEIETS